jgi:hypothetical protein
MLYPKSFYTTLSPAVIGNGIIEGLRPDDIDGLRAAGLIRR